MCFCSQVYNSTPAEETIHDVGGMLPNEATNLFFSDLKKWILQTINQNEVNNCCELIRNTMYTMHPFPYNLGGVL